eukprot:gene3872-55_t
MWITAQPKPLVFAATAPSTMVITSWAVPGGPDIAVLENVATPP